MRILITAALLASFMVITPAVIAQTYDIVNGRNLDDIGDVTLTTGVGQVEIVSSLDASATIDLGTTDPVTRLSALTITGAHIHAAVDDDWGNAVNKKGCPRPGRFDHKDDDGNYTVTGLGGTGLWDIAIHYEISGIVEELVSTEPDEWEPLAEQPDPAPTETAWAEGTDFEDCPNWAMFIDLDLEGSGLAAPGVGSTLATRWGAIKSK